MKRMSTAVAAVLMASSGFAASPAEGASEAELQFWRSVENSGQVGDYRAYLEQYPDGDFAPLARNRIRENESTAGAETNAEASSSASAEYRSPAAREASLDLTYDERREVQSRLVAQGYDTRGVDGVFGPGTRDAISRWQRAGAANPSGYLTKAQARGLLTGSADAKRSDEDRATASYTSPESRERALNLDREQRVAIQTALVDKGYDTRGVGGVFGRGTRQAVNRWQRASGETATGFLTEAQARTLIEASGRASAGRGERRSARRDARAREEALQFDSVQRTEVEQRLSYAGYDPGRIDGDYTRETRGAIRAFRDDRGLERGRFLDAAMVRRLVDDTNAEFSANANANSGANGPNIDPDVAAAVAAGALAVGGAILLDDD